MVHDDINVMLFGLHTLLTWSPRHLTTPEKTLDDEGVEVQVQLPLQQNCVSASFSCPIVADEGPWADMHY